MSEAPDLTIAPEKHYLEQELEQRLKDEPDVFRFLQEGSLDGLWYWDLEKPEHEWLSPRFKAVFGYADHEIPNTPDWWQQNIHPDDLPTVLERFEAHAADPAVPFDQLVRYRHKDGSTVWVRCRGIAIRDASGKPIRMLGAHTDVTDLQRAKEELQSLYEDTPAMMHSLGREGEVLFVSQRWLEHFGYERDEVVGRRITEFVGESSRALLDHLLNRAFDLGRFDDAPLTVRRKNGEARRVKLSVTIERSPRGEPVRARGVVHDVTELLEAEDSARQERTLRDRLFAATPDAIVVADRNRRIVAMNPAAETMFQRSALDAAGAQTRILYAEEASFHQTGSSHYNDHADPNPEPYDMEYRRADDERFVGQTFAFILRGDRPAEDRFVAIIRDITAARAEEEARARAKRALADSVACLQSLTRGLQEVIAHPEHGVMQTLEALEAACPPEARAAIAPHLDRLRSLGKRDTRLMGRFLEWSAQPLLPEVTETDVAGLVQACAEAAQTKQPHLAITWTAASDLSALCVAQDGLRFALDQVFDDIGHRGRGQATHVTLTAALAGDELRLTIADDAPAAEAPEPATQTLDLVSACRDLAHQTAQRCGGAVIPMDDGTGTRIVFPVLPA